ncbi:MAG TPA: hypothetical protein VFS21_09805 [Roseiflexaceae bacterium]|nr:hypothetical protein [Roseiflexaceae bacterium]
MTLRKLASLRLPEPPEKVPEVRDVLNQAFSLPLLAPIRLFWNSLLEMRDWWPVLLPLLLFTGWRAYRAERRRLLAHARDALPPAPTA